MRTVRIFQVGLYQPGQQLQLTPEASHHVGQVLRMQIGDSLTLFCGDNQEFSARIYALQKKQVVVQIESSTEVDRESPLNIHLAQAISKGDRMDFVMQKAVELGVTSISPIISQHCAVRLNTEKSEKKVHLWQVIAIAACEQSGRNCVPQVHNAMTFDSYIKDCEGELKLILNPEATKSWRDFAIKKQPIQLLVGPEGGFSLEETTMALAQGFQSISLGPRILRTETAAISMISILQALGGDL
ncbi:MAG: 16S rRNA (uracil(1498)-N(3))-methyltransferase [Legionella sp.]|nr:16S rRNA (uracil(1498)-N(3))-methyltransferase [Legionella sp.]